MYAVHKGRQTGIYYSWSDTEAQVKSYPKAVYRKCQTRYEAEYFVANGKLPLIGEEHEIPVLTGKQMLGKLLGKEIEIDKLIKPKIDNPPEQINISDSQFDKKYKQTTLMNFFKNLSNTNTNSNTETEIEVEEMPESSDDDRNDINNFPKEEHNVTEFLDTEQTTGINMQSHSDYLIDYASNLYAQLILPSDKLVIYTDGSSINNGKIYADTGYGVFMSNGTNFHQRLKGTYLSNNVAELTAILKALEYIKSDDKAYTSITIKTDSQYTINCLCKWYKGWVKKNWKKKDGRPVKNKDLIQQIKKLSDELDVKYEHVKAHTVEGSYKMQFDYHFNNGNIDSLGNAIADYLAIQR